MQMQFVEVFLSPSDWGVTVYKLYAMYTCMGFMYDLSCCLTWHSQWFKNRNSAV